MKITTLAAAAAIISTAIVPGLAAPAAAQHRVGHGGWHTRKVCRVENHHGHRTRVCRTVRYR